MTTLVSSCRWGDCCGCSDIHTHTNTHTQTHTHISCLSMRTSTHMHRIHTQKRPESCFTFYVCPASAAASATFDGRACGRGWWRWIWPSRSLYVQRSGETPSKRAHAGSRVRVNPLQWCRDFRAKRCGCGPGSLPLCRCVFVCGSVARGVVLGQAASLFVGVFVCGSVVRGCGFLREVPPIIIVCIGVCGTTHTDTHRHARMYTRTHTRTRSHNHTHTHAHTQGLSQQRLGPHDPPASSGGWSPWGGPQQQAPVGFSLFHNP